MPNFYWCHRVAAQAGSATVAKGRLATAAVYLLLVLILLVPSEGLECTENKFFDKGTGRCESCCDICCNADHTRTAQLCSSACPGYTAKFLSDNTQKDKVKTVKENPKRDSPNNVNETLTPGVTAAIAVSVLFFVLFLSFACYVLVKRRVTLRTCRRDPEQNRDLEATVSLQEAAPAHKPALATEVSGDASCANTVTEGSELRHFETGPSSAKKPVQETVEGNNGTDQIALLGQVPECHFFDPNAADDTQMKTFIAPETEGSFGCDAQEYCG